MNKETLDLLIKKDIENINKLPFHLALNRALIIIAQNYTQNLLLSSVAEKSFISQSHLSYLFRSTLNTSFKKLISILRIEKAKKLLEKNPNIKNTELCMSVGFSDLSHFEKIFKRVSLISIREYRIKKQKPQKSKATKDKNFKYIVLDEEYINTSGTDVFNQILKDFDRVIVSENGKNKYVVLDINEFNKLEEKEVLV